MLIQKHSVLIVSLLAAAAIGGALISTLKNTQESNPPPRQEGGPGTVEEAFAVASREVRRQLSNVEADEFVIDPDFRSAFINKAKIWTIKGYAWSADKSKAYKWTIIVNYDGVGEWEILIETITPMSTQAEPSDPRAARAAGAESSKPR